MRWEDAMPPPKMAIKNLWSAHINQSRYSVLKRKHVPPLLCKYFSATALIFFFFFFSPPNIEKILISKIMVKISKEIRMRIGKMAKNMSLLAIAKELGISRSSISVILKSQGTGSVSAQPRCIHLQKMWHMMVWKLSASFKNMN